MDIQQTNKVITAPVYIILSTPLKIYTIFLFLLRMGSNKSICTNNIIIILLFYYFTLIKKSIRGMANVLLINISAVSLFVRFAS